MKKTNIKIGMKVIKSKVHYQSRGLKHTDYGEIIEEPFLEKNSYKGVWRVKVKFEDGREEDIAIARIKERSE